MDFTLPADIAEIQTAYESALLEVNKIRAEQVLMGAIAAMPSPLAVAELCLAPVLEGLGAAWEQGDLSLSQLYLASRISEDLVERLLPLPADLRGAHPLIALVLLEDYHVLGKRLVHSALRLAGIHALDYGRMDAQELVEKVKQDPPELLLVSTLMLRSALRVRDVREGLNKAGVHIPIYVGGAPFRLDPQLWKEVGAQGVGSSSTDAIRLVREFLERKNVA